MLNKLDLLQRKGLRKILKLETTYVNRDNTNAVVMDRTNEKFKQQGGNNCVNKSD